VSRRKKFNENIQRFGRSLLLPIAVMAPVGMVLGISGALVQSYMIERLPFLGNPILNTILVSLRDIANIVFANIPLMFAMGVAYGMSRNQKGIAVFASVLSYLVLLTTMNVWLKVSGTLADAEDMANVGQAMVLGIQTLRLDALGGIISGLIAAAVADRFYDLELPLALAFFGGTRSVPIISMGLTMVVGIIIPFFWQFITNGLIKLSSILLNKPFGSFIFITMNRLLIPFGLHHVWNSMIRFTAAGGTYTIAGETVVGIMPALNKIIFELGPSHESWSLLPELTRFGSQNQMIMTMFALPAIGLAIYKTAFDENKKFVKGMVITMVLTAFLGNVTEPVEFSFLFIAPLLFLFHSVAMGIVSVILFLMNTAVGYIRGTVFDFIIFGLMYENTRWYNIILVGVPVFILYYIVFKWAIEKWNVPTPGRETDSFSHSRLLEERKYGEIAGIIVAALGGRENITHVDNCITRLRIDLLDNKKVDRDLLRESGTSGVFFPSSKHIHIVFGPHVEFIKNALDRELKGELESN